MNQLRYPCTSRYPLRNAFATLINYPEKSYNAHLRDFVIASQNTVIQVAKQSVINRYSQSLHCLESFLNDPFVSLYMRLDCLFARTLK